MLIKGSRDTVFTNLVQQGTAIVIFLVLPNVLPVGAFAEVTFVTVLLSFGILADCGMSFVYGRKMPGVFARADAAEISRWNSSMFWTAMAGSGGFAVAVAGIYYGKYGNLVGTLLLLPVPSLAAIAAFSIARSTAKSDFSGYRKLSSFQAAVRLVVVPLAYALGLAGWFIGQLVSAATTLFRIDGPALQPGRHFDRGLVRAHLAEGAMLVATTFLWLQLLYSGRLFAAMYYPDEVIAAYGLCNAGYQVVASLVIAAFLPITVQALKLCADHEREAARFVFRVMSLSVPAVFVLGVLAAELAPFLFSTLFPRYEVDAFVVRALVYSLFSFPILVTLGNLFIGRGRAAHYLAVLCVCLAVNWILMVALMPSLGYRAAAVGQLASISLCALLMVIVSFFVFADLIEAKSCKFAATYGQLGALVGIYWGARTLWA